MYGVPWVVRMSRTVYARGYHRGWHGHRGTLPYTVAPSYRPASKALLAKLVQWMRSYHIGVTGHPSVSRVTHRCHGSPTGHPWVIKDKKGSGTLGVSCVFLNL